MATKTIKPRGKVAPSTPAAAAPEPQKEQIFTAPRKKRCFFCENQKVPTYTDVVTLKRFLSDRARIINHQRSGVCSKHQRGVSKAIKHARHLSLLPFVNQL